jgi:two-component system, sensor histidine kinase and response regulator
MINASDILKASILIVDDQQADVLLLEHALRGAGFTCIASTMNPHEVCELHRKNCYALILLDLQMPEMDGFQVMEGLTAIETEGYLSVLVLTAHPTHKLRALKAGAKDFVAKPPDLAEVLLRVHNLLEVRLLHQESSLRTAQLEATNHELESFSYSVSHDLRTPLRHIAGFSRILVNDFGPVMAVEAREYLQLVEDAVRRMVLLVEDLLSLAKLGQQSLKLCRSELNAIVDEVISMLQPDCNGRDVEWRIAKLPALDCDPILMAQVFQNLLGNALKYSRNRTYAVIEVDSIQRPGKPPIIFVRDNGAGFNRKYADRLFGAFQRFHTDSEFEGTGVGLATVHRIIQKHGGTIWAESEPDHGATFYFALQMTEQVGATPKATAAS